MKKYPIGQFAKTAGFLLTGILSMLCGCAGKQESQSLFGLVSENEALGDADLSEELSDINMSESENDSAFLETETAFVHICGAVICPGVYEVPLDSRIYDVLMLAGGFTDEAAEDYLNLAAPISDGMQIRILSREEAEAEKKRQAQETMGLININTASLAELCTLPGIGESRAEDIIAYRTDNGAFATKEEIMQVSGIKDAMYEKIRDKIYVE